MAALSYRQQVAPENFDTRIPDNGNAALADHLGSLFGHVGDELGDLGGQLNAQAGAQQGTDDGSYVDKDAVKANAKQTKDKKEAQFWLDQGPIDEADRKRLTDIVNAPLAATPKSRIDLRTGIAATTRYGQSYNNSAVPAYVAKTQSDVQQTYAQLDSDFDNGTINLDTYKAKSAAYVSQLNDSTPQQLKSQIGFIVNAHANAGLLRVQDAQIKKDHAEAEGSYLDAQSASADAVNKAYEVSQAAGDAAAHQAFISDKQQRDSLEASHAISPVKSAHYGKVFETTIHSAIGEGHVHSATDKLMSVARANGVSQAGHAFNDLMASKDYSDEDKQKIGARYSAQLGQYKVAQSARYAENVASLRERLAGGESGGGIKAQALAYHDKGAISDDELAGIYAESARNAKEGQKKTFDIQSMRDAIHNNTPLDPRMDEQHKKALDQIFQEDTAGTTPGDPRWTGVALDMMHKNNVLAESAESWARTVAVSGDPQHSAQAASFIDKVVKANPAAADYFQDTKLRAFTDSFVSAMATGVDAARAHDLAYKKAYSQDSEALQNIQKEKYKADLKQEDNVSALRSAVNGDDHFNPHWWSSVPAVPDGMQAEYDTLVSGFYGTTGGSITQSRKLAQQVVLQHWGVDDALTGTPEIVKYPPGKLHGVTRDEVVGDLQTHFDNAKLKIDASTAQLVPDPDLYNYTKGKVFNVTIPDEYGNPDFVRGTDNSKMKYSLPMGTDIGAARSKAEDIKRGKDLVKRSAYLERRKLYNFDSIKNNERTN